MGSIDEAFGDNYAQSLEALQNTNYTIFNKKQETYNIHNQARSNAEKNTPQSLKEVEHQGYFAEGLQSSIETALDVLDVKPLLNPLLKTTIGYELPENLFTTKEREQYLKDVRENIEYKIANGLEFDSGEINRLTHDDLQKNFFNTEYATKIEEMQRKGKTTQEISEYLHNFFKNKKDILNIDKYDDLNENQKAILDKEFNLADDIVDYFSNTTDQERLEKYKEAQINDTITKKATQALVWLENTDLHTDFLALSAVKKITKSAVNT
ncbi:hypothetical protein ACRE1S_04165 [Helicobacter himalayensis]|uniref:hypothetical protein n=1 Tax=Helicobacter himalayensis TaxID=1591088 RepID=UPI003D6DD8CE